MRNSSVELVVSLASKEPAGLGNMVGNAYVKMARTIAEVLYAQAVLGEVLNGENKRVCGNQGDCHTGYIAEDGTVFSQ